MSALPPNANMCGALAHVRFVAKRTFSHGIHAHWPYRLMSTSEFEYGQGYSEVVQPDQKGTDLFNPRAEVEGMFSFTRRAPGTSGARYQDRPPLLGCGVKRNWEKI